jgi:hypothetical protein
MPMLVDVGDQVRERFLPLVHLRIP